MYVWILISDAKAFVLRIISADFIIFHYSAGCNNDDVCCFAASNDVLEQLIQMSADLQEHVDGLGETATDLQSSLQVYRQHMMPHCNG